MKSTAIFMLMCAATGVIALAAVACGDGGEETSLEAYFQQLETIGEELGIEIERVIAADPNGRTSETYFEIERLIWEVAAEEYAKINPPPEVADAHSQLIDGLSDVRDAYIDADADAASIDPDMSSDERDALMARLSPNVDEASEGLTEACAELQAVADELADGPDLKCGY